nr:GNAT family protein [Chitinasiproducens palmae]
MRLEPLDPARHGTALANALVGERAARDWTYLSVGPFTDRQAYLAYLEDAAASRDALHFAVVERTTGEAVGTIAFMRIDEGNGAIEIGHVTFSPRMQRSPAATEAVHLLMAEAFDTLGNRRLEWKCDALNARSCRAADRFGFRLEGLFRQAVVYKHRSRDTAWFALTDEEWPQVRARHRAWLAPANFDETGRQRAAMKDVAVVLEDRAAPRGAA